MLMPSQNGGGSSCTSFQLCMKHLACCRLGGLPVTLNTDTVKRSAGERCRAVQGSRGSITWLSMLLLLAMFFLMQIYDYFKGTTCLIMRLPESMQFAHWNILRVIWNNRCCIRLFFLSWHNMAERWGNSKVFLCLVCFTTFEDVNTRMPWEPPYCLDSLGVIPDSWKTNTKHNHHQHNHFTPGLCDLTI